MTFTVTCLTKQGANYLYILHHSFYCTKSFNSKRNWTYFLVFLLFILIARTTKYITTTALSPTAWRNSLSTSIKVILAFTKSRKSNTTNNPYEMKIDQTSKDQSPLNYSIPYPGSRGPTPTLVPEALMQRELERQQKENSEAKRRASGLGRWESHFHVRIRFRFWTLSLIGFDRDWSNRFDIENQSNQMSTVKANQRQGSKSEPDTNMESEILNSWGQRPFSSLRSFPFAVSSAALGPLEQKNWFTLR